MNNRPCSRRVAFDMRAADITALDRLADAEEVPRAAYARKILRRHIRELAAASKPNEVAV